MLKLSYSTFFVGALLLVLLSNVRAADPSPASTHDRRIIVVGGALTEIVYALGQQRDIVAVDTTSQWPAEVKALPDIGYQRALSTEGIASLSPTLVLVSDEAGPPTVLRQLRDSGLRIETITYEDSEEGLIQKVLRVGELLDVPQRGAQLAGELARLMQVQAKRVVGLVDKPRVAFLLSVGKGSNLAAGSETTADAVIRLAGGINVLSTYRGYKPVNAEAIVQAAPDILLTTQQTLEHAAGIDGLLALPGVAATPAGKSRRVVTMDAVFLLGFGPRTPQALAELTDKLHGNRVAGTQSPTR